MMMVFLVLLGIEGLSYMLNDENGTIKYFV